MIVLHYLLSLAVTLMPVNTLSSFLDDLQFPADVELKFGDESLSSQLRALSLSMKKSFNQRLWRGKISCSSPLLSIIPFHLLARSLLFLTLLSLPRSSFISLPHLPLSLLLLPSSPFLHPPSSLLLPPSFLCLTFCSVLSLCRRSLRDER